MQKPPSEAPRGTKVLRKPRGLAASEGRTASCLDAHYPNAQGFNRRNRVGLRDWLGLRRKEPAKPADLHCTFCGKSGVEATKIIGGPPPFFICDGCVGSHSETVAREEARLAALPDDCSFCGKTRRQVRVLLGGE